MKALKCFITLIICSSALSNLSGQRWITGVNGGLTTLTSSALLTNGIKEEIITSSSELKGLTGFHIGGFVDYKFWKRFMLRSELGIEQLRFKYGTFDIRRIGEITHFKGNVLIGIEPFRWWAVMGGLELAERSSFNQVSFSSNIPTLNGTTLNGWYWQAILGTQFRINWVREIQLGLSMNLTRISSVYSSNRTVNRDPSWMHISQIRAFQVNVNVPVWTR